MGVWSIGIFVGNEVGDIVGPKEQSSVSSQLSKSTEDLTSDDSHIRHFWKCGL